MKKYLIALVALVLVACGQRPIPANLIEAQNQVENKCSREMTKILNTYGDPNEITLIGENIVAFRYTESVVSFDITSGQCIQVVYTTAD